MQHRKLDVVICRFPYGGNGGMSNEHPEVGTWLVDTVLKAKADPRVGRITERRYSDTPITMTRNRAVKEAIRDGYDVIVMVDSDQNPDHHLHDRPGAKPFWSSSFDHLYTHYERGPVVIGAPYCGPPPVHGMGSSNVYVFQWESVSDEDSDGLTTRLAQLSRTDAAMRRGIQNVDALPTGLIMFDARIFSIIEPEDEDDIAARRGWFYYEYTDKYASEKASTEDVTATRDMNLAGTATLGYNPILCNFDAWAGHTKPWIVEAPRPIASEDVAKKLAKPFLEGYSRRVEKRQNLSGRPIPVPVSERLRNDGEKRVPQGPSPRTDGDVQHRAEAVRAVRAGKATGGVQESAPECGRPVGEVQGVLGGEVGGPEASRPCRPEGPHCHSASNGCCESNG